MFQGETDNHPPLGTANCPGQECCSFFPPILPESQNPHCTLIIPCYKKPGLEKDKVVRQGMNLPYSQITGCLNKVPVKIELLGSLIGFGRDRQSERWCLFWFQNCYRTGGVFHDLLSQKGSPLFCLWRFPSPPTHTPTRFEMPAARGKTPLNARDW